MRPPVHENPPENERTGADRLADVPLLAWLLLGVLVILMFVGACFLIGHYPPAVRVP